jgi:hypothetical protein
MIMSLGKYFEVLDGSVSVYDYLYCLFHKNLKNDSNVMLFLLWNHWNSS